MRRCILVTLVALVALAACSSDGGDDGDGSTSTSVPAGAATSGAVAPTEVDLAAVAADVIVPRYQTFATEADELVSAVDGLCATPSPAALEAAQAQWGETRAAWRQTMAFGFGPAMDLRTMSDVDFGTSAGKVEDVVASTEPVTAESVAQLGANARGLGAIEQLLFGEDASTLTSTAGARRCQYAGGGLGAGRRRRRRGAGGLDVGRRALRRGARRRPAGVAQRHLQRGHPHPAGGRRPEAGHRPGGPQRRARAGGRRPWARPSRPRRHARRPRRGHGQLRGRARARHRPPVRRRRLP